MTEKTDDKMFSAWPDFQRAGNDWAESMGEEGRGELVSVAKGLAIILTAGEVESMMIALDKSGVDVQPLVDALLRVAGFGVIAGYLKAKGLAAFYEELRKYGTPTEDKPV